MKFFKNEDAFEVTTKNHGKVTVDAGKLEFPQVESSAEAIEFAGGEEKLVEQYNDLLYSRSKNGALALIRNAASDVTPDSAVERAIAYAKAYNPSQERVSKQATLDGVDTLRAMKDQMIGLSAADLMALLEKTLKL